MSRLSPPFTAIEQLNKVAKIFDSSSSVGRTPSELVEHMKGIVVLWYIEGIKNQDWFTTESVRFGS